MNYREGEERIVEDRQKLFQSAQEGGGGGGDTSIFFSLDTYSLSIGLIVV